MIRKGEALIFDFDGVLADTEPLHWKSWVEVLGRNSISLSWADYCRLGRGYRDVDMLDNLGLSDPSLRAALDGSSEERRETMRRWCAQQSPISTARVEALRAVHGYPLGLVTSSERAEVEPLLRSAGLHCLFAACVYGDEITHAKPHPQPYRLIGERLGITSGVAFEDSDAGMASAAAAGFRAVRVNNPEDLPSLLQAALAEEEPA